MKKIAILGTVGIPAIYGGFESLVENLARYYQVNNLNGQLVIYCSAKRYPERQTSCYGAELRYLNLDANGISSILYDIVSVFSAVFHGCDVILLLGVSGAVVLPLVRLLSKVRIVTNIDGIEWKREKWSGAAKWFLRFSERIAVCFSNEVIADNDGIANHVLETYGRKCHVISYGGDHALLVPLRAFEGATLPSTYALALCRIEPENNVTMILEAFAKKPDLPLVFVGNWNNTRFGQELKKRFANFSNMYLLDPIYDLGVLRSLRCNSLLYVHGHSAGGTNPSLVEMMHFGRPIIAYDCIFNRYTTENKAYFFKDADNLRILLETLSIVEAEIVGTDMRCIAKKRYTWEEIARKYYYLLEHDTRSGNAIS